MADDTTTPRSRRGRGLSIKARGGIWYFVKKIRGKLRRISTGYPVATKEAKEAALRRAAEIEVEVRAGVHGWTKDVPTGRIY